MVSPGRNSWLAGSAGPSSNCRSANFSISSFSAPLTKQEPIKIRPSNLTALLFAWNRRRRRWFLVDLKRNMHIRKMPCRGIAVGQPQPVRTQRDIEKNAPLLRLRWLQRPQKSEPVVHSLAVFRFPVQFSIRPFQFEQRHGNLGRSPIGSRNRNQQEPALRRPDLEIIAQLTSPNFFNH